MNTIKTVISISLTTLLMACAHHDNVRPSDNGEHYVKLTSETKSEAGKEAINQSNHFCEEQGKKAYIVSESIEYKGSMPEEQYLTSRGIAKAVEGAGPALWALGKNSVNDVGAAMTIGGGIAAGALGQPYELNMTFTCR